MTMTLEEFLAECCSDDLFAIATARKRLEAFNAATADLSKVKLSASLAYARENHSTTLELTETVNDPELANRILVETLARMHNKLKAAIDEAVTRTSAARKQNGLADVQGSLETPLS